MGRRIRIKQYTVALPPTDKRRSVPVTVQLGKDIRLQHAVPVLAVIILDGECKYLFFRLEIVSDTYDKKILWSALFEREGGSADC